MEAEAEGIQILMKKLVAEHRIDGMIGMGGGQGSSVLRCAVSVLPVGMPKMIVSTMAMAGGKLFPGVNDTYLIKTAKDVQRPENCSFYVWKNNTVRGTGEKNSGTGWI